MALVLADRVRETTTVVGTGTATLLGAVVGYQSFTAVGNANTTYYVIASQTANEWEVGIGTYTASGTTLSRDTVLASSNAGSLVNFSAGTKDIWVDYNAVKAVYEDAAGNVSGYPIVGGTINNTPIGNTTPNAATFTTLTATGQTSLGGAAGSEAFRAVTTESSVNWLQATGAPANREPFFSAQGSDTNISMVFQSKGTGAINLAPGSSGVNISNGGTVTAITRTASGSGYTTIPSVAVSAPTTAGGVQAVVTVAQMQIAGATIQSGGTGYTVGNTLTIVGGTPVTSAATLTVTSVSAGVITGVSVGSFTNYTVLPTNPVSVTGGTGSGATFNVNYAVISFTSTNAGSGYVEQPTVTFSGGGGSGAAAYASVGSATVLRSLAGSGGGSNSLSIFSAGGEAVRVTDAGGALVNYWRIQGAPTNSGVQLQATGADTNVSGLLSSKGTSGFSFYTNTFAQEQFRIAHTASAVNYVQVTGAATGGGTVISAQGSDANVEFITRPKGNANNTMQDGSSTAGLQVIARATNGDSFLTVQRDVSVVNLGVGGGATNADIRLTPKGTGNVRFGTYTASMAFTVQGYIEIKDSGGTVRKLAVVA